MGGESKNEELEEYTAIVSKIGGHKRYLSRLANTIPEYLDEETLDGATRIEASNLETLIKTRVDTIQEFFDQLLANSNTTEDDINQFDDYRRGVSSKLAKLTYKLHGGISKVNKNDSLSSNHSQSGWGDSAVKFPELTLPKFEGGDSGEANFRPFRQLFDALVGEKEDIPLIYKVQYLRGSLPANSEAYNLIAHIPPTEESYEIIMNTLADRYGRDSGEANRLRRKLMEVGDWPVCHSIEAQRALIDHVKQNLILLNQLERVKDEDMSTLALHILGVVPERIRYKAAKLDKCDRTVENIIRLLDKSISSKLEVMSFAPSHDSQTYRVDMFSSKANVNYNKPAQFNRGKSYGKPTNKTHTNIGNQFSTNTKHQTNHASGSSNDGPHNNRQGLSCIYCKKDDQAHSGHFCKNKPDVPECKTILHREQRCLNCLEKGHVVKNCPLATLCGCGRGKHSPSICYRGGVRREGANYMAFPNGSCPAFMETALVKAVNSKTGEACQARVFIDRGSTDSYCTYRLAKQLECEPLDSQMIHIGTFAADRTKTVSANLVDIKLISLVNNTSLPVQLLTMEKMCGDLPSHPLGHEEMRELAPYQLADYPATQYNALNVDILLGMDYLWSVMRKGVQKMSFGPCLIETEFGWMLSGPMAGRKQKGAISAHFIKTYVCMNSPMSCSSLETVLHRFWDLDTLGVKEEEISPVVAHYQENVKVNEQGRVQVSIPWKEEIKSYLPSNYHQAAIRLGQIKRKLNRPGNEDLKFKYEKVISDQLRDGIIEKIPEQPESLFVNDQPEPDSIDTNTAIIGSNTPLSKVRSYIPHHAVVKPESGKVRVVYDASCQAYPGSLSLNDVIHSGPSLLTDLAETLMSFRLHNVAIVGDIEKAYLQLALNPDDRDAFRFLWYEGEETVEYRFARVPFGVVVSSFLLHVVLQSHFQKEFEHEPQLLEKILKSLYVDDLLSGAEDVDSAVELRARLEEVLSRIGMTLHGWSSSSQVLREKWGSSVGETLQVLGLLWDPVGDALMVNVSRVLDSVDCQPTKKNLLSLTASVFDPLGILQPFLVLPKLLFQEVCKSKVGWRGSLTSEMQVKWDLWKQQLSSLTSVQIPRQVVVPGYERVELHCFADASEVAYAACCYIKTVRGSDVRVNLAFAKNRIAPLATHTLPRLELLGAGLLARIAAKVLGVYKHLQFDQVCYYTDSKNVLHWIQSDNKNWSTFVQNRVLELHTLTKARDWSYVRSERNPADVATRPISGPDLVANPMWLHGPTFMYDDTISCGDKVDSSAPTAECLLEVKKSTKVAIKRKATTILDLSKYSNYGKLINVTRLVYKFIAKKVPGFCACGPPTYFNLHNMAVRYWIRNEQLEYYPAEVENCPVGKYIGDKVANVSSVARSLRLFKDNHGILRYASRVQSPFCTYNTNNPMLLPKQSQFTNLYLANLHRSLSHAGVGVLLFHLRKSFWVPQGRVKVRSVIHACVNCRKILAKPFPKLASPPLPDHRVTPSEPFERTGIDTFGPVTYKVGKATRKGHVLLFTCATTRAVHLELITAISVQSVTFGLRRFFARYGLPKLIQSDNAKSFIRCQKELDVIMKSPKMQKYLASHRITWRRYLERSPWWGGYIEREVQTAKRSLYKVIGSAVLSFEEYTTFLYEVSALINSRPITVIYDSIDEGEPVTPSMLINGRSLVQIPPLFEVNVDGTVPQMCTGRLKYLEKLKTYFWNRWQREYLADLREIHSHRKVGTQTRQPKVGEMVLIKNEMMPRGTWKVGRVTEVKPGRDGLIRSVKVKCVRGKKLTRRGNIKNVKTIELNRSPTHLVPLEGTNEE